MKILGLVLAGTILGGIAGFQSAFGADKEIIIAGDSWCPYNCEVGAQKEGFMVDVARRIFAKKNIKVVYKTVPWTRAKMLVADGSYQGLIGANIAELTATKLVAPEVEQARMHNAFFVLNKTEWRVKNLTDLRKVKIGLVQDYDYGPDMEAYIKDPKNADLIHVVTGNDPLERLIKMLEEGRVQAIVEDKNVFNYTVAKMKMEKKFTIAGDVYAFAQDRDELMKRNNLYIGFASNSTSAEYMKILTDGMVALRKSGELKELLQAYGLNDWK